MKNVVLLLIGACSTTAEGDPGPATPRTGDGPLVVELFTSQGCSSCPPADQLLATLAHHGRPVVPLAFHVDYWNRLGWVDPFSAPAWTDRQHAYSEALHDRGVYTPELVIGGAIGLVGSRRDPIARAIADAPAVDLLVVTARWAPDQVEITATAPMAADVVVAVWEDATQTVVPTGENAGETLISTHVVRRFEQIAAAGHVGTVTVKLDPSWHEVGGVAFAEHDHGRIIAAAMLPEARRPRPDARQAR